MCNEYTSINNKSIIIFLFYTKVNVSYIKNVCDTFSRTNQKRFIMQTYLIVESTVCQYKYVNTKMETKGGTKILIGGDMKTKFKAETKLQSLSHLGIQSIYIYSHQN